MPLSKTLLVAHTVTYQGEPLACFRDLPGYDAELRPAQIRALAVALLQAANDCEALLEHTRKYGAVRREYPLASPADARADSSRIDAAGFDMDRPVFGPVDDVTSPTAPRALRPGDSPGAQRGGRCLCGSCHGTSTSPSRAHAPKTEGHQ